MENIDTKNFKFKIRLTEEIEGIVSSTRNEDGHLKEREEVLEILSGDLLQSFGEGNFSVEEFTEVSDEEVAEMEKMYAIPSDTPVTLN